MNLLDAAMTVDALVDARRRRMRDGDRGADESWDRDKQETQARHGARIRTSRPDRVM
jgi:hypothetical protein